MSIREAAGRALSKVMYPGIDRDIVSLGYVKALEERGDSVFVRVELSPTAGGVRNEIESRIKAELGEENVPFDLEVSVREEQTAAAPSPPDPLAHIPFKIAVSSAKGGVGKSTVAVNLALALAKLGHKTGLLDTDIYGPSIPIMLGLEDQQPMLDPDRGKLIPLERYGVKNVSIGYMVDRNTPMVWRGPMMSKAIDQLMRDVDWEGTEVLVFDLPPGTGDVQLSLAQKLRLSGAVIVSTPQDVALIDAVRGIRMFEKTSVPVLGIVENMSYFICSNCDAKHHIFGKDGAANEAEKQGIPLLGQLPIDPRIASGADKGHPIVFEEPDSEAAKLFESIATAVMKTVEDHRRDG